MLGQKLHAKDCLNQLLFFRVYFLFGLVCRAAKICKALVSYGAVCAFRMHSVPC